MEGLIDRCSPPIQTALSSPCSPGHSGRCSSVSAIPHHGILPTHLYPDSGSSARRGEKVVNGGLRSAARHSATLVLPWTRTSWNTRLPFSYRNGSPACYRRFGRQTGSDCWSLETGSTITLVNDYLLGRLRAQGVMAGGAVRNCPRCQGAGDFASGFLEGEFVVQDPSAIVASLALGARPGEAVWDACAAPGGKTTHLAEMMEGSGTLVATDIDASRADMVRDALGRMGLDFARVLARDASDPSLGGEPFSHGFDRILLDAPCSGLGVIRRNPDLRWNRRESDIPAMALRQTRLLESVKRYLRPGGVLVYSTCTLTKEENEDTWLRFLSRSADLVPLDPAAALDPGSAGMLSDEPFAGPGYRYILSHRSGSDGFFIARARRSDVNIEDGDCSKPSLFGSLEKSLFHPRRSRTQTLPGRPDTELGIQAVRGFLRR